MERMIVIFLALLFLVSCRSNASRQKSTQVDPAQSILTQVDESADSNAQTDHKLDEIKKRYRLLYIVRHDHNVFVGTGMLTSDQLKQITKEIKDVVGTQCKIGFMMK